MKKISLAFMAAALLLSSAGCLKDEDFDANKYGIEHPEDSPIGVGFPQGQNKINFTSLENTDAPQTFQIALVNLLSDEPTQEDIHVTLVEDPSLVSAYNEKNDANLVALPTDGFNIQTMVVTIPKGQRTGTLTLNIPDAKNKLDITQTYGLGFRIASVQEAGITISSNFKTILVGLTIKNEWQADYHAVGVFTHPVAGPRDIDEIKELTTVGVRSVEAPLGDLGASGYYMILTVNTDNTVTITPSGVTPNVDQHWGPNFYDPTTKAFHLHYSYNVAAPRIVEEILTRE